MAGSVQSKTLYEMEDAGYKRINDAAEAEALWNFWFTHSEHKCIHGGLGA